MHFLLEVSPNLCMLLTARVAIVQPSVTGRAGVSETSLSLDMQTLSAYITQQTCRLDKLVADAVSDKLLNPMRSLMAAAHQNTYTHVPGRVRRVTGIGHLACCRPK